MEETTEKKMEKIHQEARAFMDKQRELMQVQIQFAESKNTVLLAFNGTAIIGAIAAIVALGQNNKLLEYFFIAIYAVNVSLMCSVAVFYNLASMYAQRHQFKVASKALYHDGNLVFWGAIADQKSGEEYLIKVMKQYWKTDIQESQLNDWQYELDGAKQTVILAGIARRKYNYFNESVMWTMSGLLTPLAIVIQKFFFSPDKELQQLDGYKYYVQPLKLIDKYE